MISAAAERLDRRARRRAGVADQHPARRRGHRADVLGGRRGRLAGVSEACERTINSTREPSQRGNRVNEARPTDVDTGWLWLVAVPMMVTGYMVDLVGNDRPRPPIAVYVFSGLFVFVIAAVVVTFLFLMRQGYRWARTVLTGGGSPRWCTRDQPVLRRPPDHACGALRHERHRRLRADRRGSVPAAPQGRPRLLRSLSLPTCQQQCPPARAHSRRGVLAVAAGGDIAGASRHADGVHARQSAHSLSGCRNLVRRGGPGSRLSGGSHPGRQCRIAPGRRRARLRWLCCWHCSRMTGGVLWLIPMILTMVGAVLIMRPSAQDWFHIEETP